jgi:oligopeptidase B
MNLIKTFASAFVVILLVSCGNPGEQKNAMNSSLPPAPKAKKIAYNLTEHGDTRVDNYYWMRLSDEQKNAPEANRDQQTKDVLEYLNSENDYTKKVLGHTDAFQKELFEEMKGRIKEDDQSVPVKDKGYFYYTRYESGKDYAFQCRKKDSMESGTEEVLINGPEMAAGHDYWALGGMDISDNNELMCYSEDVVSRRIYNASFRNLATGEVLADKLEGLAGSPVWAGDNRTVFYVKKDPTTLREFQVWRHVLGTSQDKDVLVFEEKDEEFHCGVSRTKSDQYMVIGTYQTLSSEYMVLDAKQPEGEFKVIQPRERNHEYSIDHYNDKFYITTNWEAKNFRLMETSVNATTKENWKEVIAHRDDVFLEGTELFRDFLVVEERKNGLGHVRVIRWSDKSEYYLDFADPAYTVGVGANPDFNTDILRYGYSSMTTPASTYDYNMSTKERELKKQQEVVGGHNPEDYTSERLYAKAVDGTMVPISLVYKKGTKLDGTLPFLLYAYGSYGATMDAGFSSTRLTLLNRGFIYAIAHIRGGQEMGRYWYEDGKLLKEEKYIHRLY